MMRWSEAAAIEVRQISTPTLWRNLSSVSHGQTSNAAAIPTHPRCLRRAISRFRITEDAPGTHDQQKDHHAERQEGGRRRPVERSDEAFGETEDGPAERRARDRAH